MVVVVIQKPRLSVIMVMVLLKYVLERTHNQHRKPFGSGFSIWAKGFLLNTKPYLQLWTG